MKKIMQIAVILVFVSATNGYGWDWPWKNWFKIKVGENYTKLATIKEIRDGKTYEYVEIPENLEPGQNYALKAVGMGNGKEFFIKPSEKSDDELNERSQRVPKSVTRQRAPFRIISTDDFVGGKRNYLKPAEPNDWPRHASFGERRAFTPKAETAFKRAQSGE